MVFELSLRGTVGGVKQTTLEHIRNKCSQKNYLKELKCLFYGVSAPGTGLLRNDTDKFSEMSEHVRAFLAILISRRLNVIINVMCVVVGDS